MPRLKPQDYLTAEPLLAHLDRVGGLNALPYPCMEDANNDEEWENVKDAARKAFSRMRESGMVNLFNADRICIDYFGAHPMVVYGMDWFELNDPACPIRYYAAEEVAA